MSNELALAQFSAYLMLTLASVTVAVVSLLIAYRQNFGWKPLALAIGHGLAMRPEHKGHYEAIVTFEVWNRRKYPVVVRAARVRFSVVDIEWLLKGWEFDDKWYIQGRELSHRQEVVLEPAGHHRFSASAPFVRRKLDDLLDPVAVEIVIFDPLRNKVSKSQLVIDYHFGAAQKK